MTTNLLSVIEQQHKALEMLQGKLTGNVNGADEHCFIISMKNQVSFAQMVRVSEAIEAGQQALEQTQGEAVSVDWQDMYRRQKRRAEMWIAKYEKDIGPLEKVHPQASEPLSHAKPESTAGIEDAAITPGNGSEPAPNPLDALTKTCEGLGLYEADFEPAPSTAGERAKLNAEYARGRSDGWDAALLQSEPAEESSLVAGAQPVREPLKGDSNAVP